MTKRELLNKLDELLSAKGMYRIDNGNGKVNGNCNKDEIESAIQCLKATDEEMKDYLTVIKLKLPNTYKTIVNNGDWLTHYHNRYYVWTTARRILA